MPEVELLADVGNTIGESPVWLDAEAALYWVDAEGSSVFRWHASTGSVKHWNTEVPVTALVPRMASGWILITKDGLYSATADFATIERIIDPSAHDERTRLNDGVADEWGRIWTGTQSRTAPDDPIGRLYLVDAISGATEIDDGFANANGIAISPDRSRVWVSDMFHRRIRVYDIDPQTGACRDRLAPIETQGPGYPDGLAIDQDGMLWVGYWGGGRVERRDPAGSILASVALPVDHATRACLGGLSGSRLFITSARFKLAAEHLERQPQAGAVFSIEVDAVGLSPARARL